MDHRFVRSPGLIRLSISREGPNVGYKNVLSFVQHEQTQGDADQKCAAQMFRYSGFAGSHAIWIEPRGRPGYCWLIYRRRCEKVRSPGAAREIFRDLIFLTCLLESPFTASRGLKELEHCLHLFSREGLQIQRRDKKV